MNSQLIRRVARLSVAALLAFAMTSALPGCAGKRCGPCVSKKCAKGCDKPCCNKKCPAGCTKPCCKKT